jgi:hypothetical protein
MDGDGEVKLYSNYLIHLPIVQGLLLCKTLDVMHCKKNQCENVMETVFGAKDLATI